MVIILAQGFSFGSIPPLSLLRLLQSLPTWPSHVPWKANWGKEPYRSGKLVHLCTNHSTAGQPSSAGAKGLRKHIHCLTSELASAGFAIT